MEESARKGKRRKIVGRERGMKRRGTSDQMTHFLLCFSDGVATAGLEVSEKSPPSSSESSNRPPPDAEWGFC